MLNAATEFVLSDMGRYLCALLLFFVVWSIKNVPFVKDKILTTFVRRRLAVMALAALPAVAMALLSNASAEQIFDVFLVAVAGAMGIHSFVSQKKTDAKGAVDDEPPDDETDGEPPDDEQSG